MQEDTPRFRWTACIIIIHQSSRLGLHLQQSRLSVPVCSYEDVFKNEPLDASKYRRKWFLQRSLIYGITKIPAAMTAVLGDDIKTQWRKQNPATTKNSLTHVTFVFVTPLRPFRPLPQVPRFRHFQLASNAKSRVIIQPDNSQCTTSDVIRTRCAYLCQGFPR